MQVVFIQDVPSVAKRGDVKNVKDGYFQNFLLPRKIAAVATPVMIRKAEEMRKKASIEKEKVRGQAQEIKSRIDGFKITLKRKAKGDKLYGSINEKELADILEKEFKVKLGKEHILLSEHIKVAGSYEVPVRLAEDVEAKILLDVKGEK